MRLAAATRVLRGTVPESAILPLLFPQLRTAPPTLGTRQLLQAYAEMPWFRAVCDKTADAVASVRWRVLAVKPQGQTRFVRPLGIQRAGFLERAKRLKTHQLAGEVVEILEHPLLQLMHEANPWFTGGEHRKLTQIYLDSVGEAGWIKERNGAGAPMAVWPLPPHWVRELPSPARPFFTVAVDRQPFTLPLSEVIWFKHAHPVNPFGRGTGIGGALGDELETDEYAARHLKQWFFNSARPDLIVTMEGASEPELRRAEQHWLDRHQGFWRAFKPFFANRKAEVKEIGQSFRDMQLTQLRDQERDVITQVFGVPPEIFGIIENSNRSTVDAADFLMAKHVTIPRLEFMRETLQERLVPEYDDRIVLDYESPLEEDREFQLKAGQAQPAALTVDEWRELQGKPPLEQDRGKVFLTPTTVVATTLPGGPPDAPPVAPQGASVGAPRLGPGRAPTFPDPVEVDDSVLDSCLGGLEISGDLHRVLLPPGVAAKDLVGITRDPAGGEDFYATVHRIADRLAPRWRKAFLEVMAQLAGQVLQHAVEEALRSGNIEAVARLLPKEVVARVITESRFAGLLRATAVAAGHAAALDLSQALEISLSFSELNPHSVAFIREATGNLITEVSEETVRAVRHIIERSFREAIAPRDAAKLIRGVIGLHSRQAEAVANFRARLLDAGVTGEVLERRVLRYAEAQLRYRALLIARTETIHAANAGQQLLWEQASREGLLDKTAVRRLWLVTPDDRLDTRICEPMPHLDENQDVKLDQPFTTGGGDRVMVPPAHPSCRCAVALRFVTP